MTGWREVLSREAERWLAGRDIKKKKSGTCVSSICRIWDDLLDTDQEKGSIISTGNCVALHMLSENSSKHSAAGGTDELQMGWQGRGRVFLLSAHAAQGVASRGDGVCLSGTGKSEVLHQQLRWFKM